MLIEQNLEQKYLISIYGDFLMEKRLHIEFQKYLERREADQNAMVEEDEQEQDEDGDYGQEGFERGEDGEMVGGWRGSGVFFSCLHAC